MLPITNASNNFAEEHPQNQNLITITFKSFLDFTIKMLKEGTETLQEIEKNEQLIQSYKKKQRKYDLLFCSIPKIICALPILSCACICDSSINDWRCDAQDCDGCGKLKAPWWGSQRLLDLISVNSELRRRPYTGYFYARQITGSHPPTLKIFETITVQLIKLQDSQHQPLILDYLHRIPLNQQKLLNYNNEWYQSTLKYLYNKTDLKTDEVLGLNDMWFSGRYSPMAKILLDESFLNAFDYTIKLRSISRDILGYLPEVLVNIFLEYIGIPTPEEEQRWPYNGVTFYEFNV